MPEFEFRFLAEKVFVHRWPHDPPLWSEEVKKHMDSSISKNPENKKIIVHEKIIQIEDFKFSSLKKIGISVPFFKEECRMIFEAKFGDFFAHIHITVKSKDYLEIFNKLMAWKKSTFPDD